MASVILENITKTFGKLKSKETAIDEVSLSIEDGEFLVIVGPSGCGKSTTLRLISGLERVTSGRIRIGERDVTDFPPEYRNVAMVFQDFALYPKKTVRENMGYGLKHSENLSKKQRREKIESVSEVLDINDILDNSPDELSGGQKQRVALGRAIVRDPEVFLLDEPLSNLDADLREHLRTELLQLQRDLDVTMIYVTHDQKEAMTMGDRIAILRDGVLQQVGDPEEAYQNPNNKFVATFLGSPEMNIINCQVRTNEGQVQLDAGEQSICSLDSSIYSGLKSMSNIEVGIRPEDLSFQQFSPSSGFRTTVQVIEYQGDEQYVYCDALGEEITIRVAASEDIHEDEELFVALDPDDLYLFDQSGQLLSPNNDSKNPYYQTKKDRT